MPKVSGLALGEIKKMSGLSLGTIKKVSGLGLGQIWQDAVPQGMYKNGNFAITTAQQTATSWAAEAGSTVLSDALRIPSAGNYNLELRCVVNNGNFLQRWVQFWIYKNAAIPELTGTQQNLSASQTGYIYTLNSSTPLAYGVGDMLSVQVRGQAASMTLVGGVDCYLHATPV